MHEDTNETDGDGSGRTESGLNRRTVRRGSSALAGLAAAGVSIGGVAAGGDTEEGDIEALLEDLPNNWGRWGEDSEKDELGALNFLGSEEMFDGMIAAIQRGRNAMEGFTLQVPMTGFEAPEEASRTPSSPPGSSDGATTSTTSRTKSRRPGG